MFRVFAGGRSTGKAVGGGTDALEESVGAIQRQRAVQQGLEDTVERAQDGLAVGEGAETDGGGVGPHQSAVAAARTQVELLVMAAAGAAGEWKRAARRSIVLEHGAEPGFHRFSYGRRGVPPTPPTS